MEVETFRRQPEAILYADSVTPAKAGVQEHSEGLWIPASAGMTDNSSVWLDLGAG